jgi:hypothetical protein
MDRKKEARRAQWEQGPWQGHRYRPLTPPWAILQASASHPSTGPSMFTRSYRYGWKLRCPPARRGLRRSSDRSARRWPLQRLQIQAPDVDLGMRSINEDRRFSQQPIEDFANRRQPDAFIRRPHKLKQHLRDLRHARVETRAKLFNGVARAAACIQ